MSERIYQVVFRDHSGTVTGVIDLASTMRMRYSKELNGVGSFLLAIPSDRVSSGMLTLDGFVQVIFYDDEGPVVDGTYFLRYYGYSGVGDVDILTITGRSLEHLLSRRIFLAEDDPLEANGFSTKLLPADTLMCEIVYEQCISPATNSGRAFPSLAAAAAAGTFPTQAFREQSSDTTVLALLMKLAKASGCDFWIEYSDGPTLTFTTGTIGTDQRKSVKAPLGEPHVYFSPLTGSLDRPELIVNRTDEKNHVYVFGQGPTGEDLVYNQSASTVNDSPWNDIEFGVNARNTKTLDDWLTEANAALNENAANTAEFSFVPQRTSLLVRYGRDWGLGDKVTAEYRGLEFEMRISAISVTVSGDGDTVEPTMELLPSG